MLKKPLLVLAFIAVGLLFALWLALRPGPLPPVPPLPNPNGYDDLVKAAGLVPRSVEDFTEMDQASLLALISTNTESLRLAHLGLSRACAVPTDNLIANFGAMTTVIVELKQLGKLLVAEGRLAEMENRSEDAMQCYLNSIRLGIAMSRGGLMINRLVGLACEGLGSSPLGKLATKSGCNQTQPVIRELEKLDRDTVPWDSILRNEDRFARAQAGQYSNPLRLVSDWWLTRPMKHQAKLSVDIAAASLRLLTAELALRCYRSEKGVPPDRLDQLVPRYLQQVPLDPFRRRALAYHPQGTNWLLYSVGPDRRDDGGKPLAGPASGDYLIGLEKPKTPAKGDLFYDSRW